MKKKKTALPKTLVERAVSGKLNVNAVHISQKAAIVDSSDDAIVSKSLRGIIKSWNKGAKKMFGFTSAEAVGKHISIIIPQEYIQEEKVILDKLYKNEIVDDYETIRNKKNGERFFVSLTMSPLKNKRGKIIGVSKIARNITARKQNENEIIKSASQRVFENRERERTAEELSTANKELLFQNGEKEKRAAELIVANKELAFQNEEKEKRAAELSVANKELIFQNEEKEKRAGELIVANKELAFQNDEKEKRAAELIVANEELAFQNEEKEKRAAELLIANKELIYQNQEKEKRAAELIIANEELAFQNKEKENRAAELFIANKELAYQNEEKEKRAAELIVANGQLVIQNQEKEKRAAELIVANTELAFQNKEKENRAAELIVANQELAYQNEEKEKRAAELVIANNELIKVEEQFRLVVEAAPNAMIVVNSDGLITLVNNQTEKLFGYERNELIDKKLEMLIPVKFHHQHPDFRNTFFLKPRTRSMGAGRDLFALCKNGTEIQVEIGLNPIETLKGQMVLASIVDITERKMQEQALIKHNKELEQFAYVASHDLQEPLRTVSNYMEVFEEDYLPLLDENARRYIHSVKRATERMSVLIKSLLAFSRLGHNKILVNVDCGFLIKEVIADLDTMISKSGASIQVGPMPTLDLYEIEMRQVFQNLLTNAIKFRKKDTRPEIRINSEKTETGWKFSIQDNGIGIVRKSFDRVFDIFQRLDTTEKYEGSGIGLANCKKIVHLHKGEIWLESELGKGTTFYFTISNLTE